MMKSFYESNGTVLSTNWKEVGAKTVCFPPCSLLPALSAFELCACRGRSQTACRPLSLPRPTGGDQAPRGRRI